MITTYVCPTVSSYIHEGTAPLSVHNRMIHLIYSTSITGFPCQLMYFLVRKDSSSYKAFCTQNSTSRLPLSFISPQPWVPIAWAWLMLSDPIFAFMPPISWAHRVGVFWRWLVGAAHTSTKNVLFSASSFCVCVCVCVFVCPTDPIC